MTKIKMMAVFLVFSLVAGCSPRPKKESEPELIQEELAEFDFPEVEEELKDPKMDENDFRDTEENENKKKEESKKEEEKKDIPTELLNPDSTPAIPHPLKEVTNITDEALSDALSRPLNELEALDNTSIVWGPGGTSGEQRPVAVVDLQQQYGDHGALFVVPNSEEIFLSFDEGYELGYTPAMIDTLTEKGVTGVFFVTLGYVQSRPDLVQRMIDGGHIVGNHSSAHPVGGMPVLSAVDQGKDILYLHNYVKVNFDYEMTLFRPPEGTFSMQSLEVAKSLGYTSAFWSFAYNDWNPENQMEPGKAIETIVNQTHPGAVYLLHAVSATNATVLGNCIDQMREKGYIISDWSSII